MLINTDYQILNSSGEFVDFYGIAKSTKTNARKITLENNKNIIVSDDHVFIAGNKNVHVKSLTPNVSYLTTEKEDSIVRSIECVEGGELYDIVDSENCDYYANGILNHNCSFLGSGDNFIAEEFLKRIEENEIETPIRQEYSDGNMWIWEDPLIGEDYLVAIDVSPGHGDDYSTVNILKIIESIENRVVKRGDKIKKVKVRKTKSIQVAEYYGKLTPQMLAEVAYQYCKRYNNARCVVDITGGHGGQTVEKLIEFGYDNVHYSEITHKPSRDMLHGYIKQGQKTLSDGSIVTVDLIPGFFIGSNRPSVLLELQRAINLGDVVIKSIRLLNELKTFVTVSGNRVADHKRSFHDDSIMGLSIGLYVLSYDMDRFKQGSAETAKKMLDAMMTSNDINNKANPNNKPIIPSTPNASNPYQANSWLFAGLKK